MNAQPWALHHENTEKERPAQRFLAFLMASGALLLLGGLFNIIVVATGVRDVMAVPLLAAFGFAALLLLLQYILGSKVAGNGFLGLGYAAAYAALMMINVILATGGVTSIGFSNRLGQTGFERSIAGVTPEIVSVADAYRSISARLESLAAYSAARADDESTNGGTCGASPRGQGPIFRLRMRDRDEFATLSGTFARLSAQMAEAHARADGLVAGYRVERHEEIARGVNEALATARAGASHPALDSMRRQLTARLAGVSAGVIDTADGGAVICPDSRLQAEISAVMEAPVPQVPEADDLPARPSHETAVIAFVTELVGALGGQGFDWSLWGVPLILGLIPDAIFMLGLAQARRDRRLQAGVLGKLAEGHVAAGASWSGLRAAAVAAADDEALHRLASFHHRRVRLFGVTDYLVIPADRDHFPDYLLAHRIRFCGYASYVGIGAAGRLPEAALPAIPPERKEVLAHFFVFHTGAWDELLLDALKASKAPHRASGEDV
jgi:hypothetical protein